MMISWNNVKNLGKVMDTLMKTYHFRSDLVFEDEQVKLIIDFEYGEFDKIKNLVALWFPMFLEKNITGFCYEVPNDFPKDIDLCKAIINLKF